MPASIEKRDFKHNWHPCSQMGDYATFPPIVVKNAKGPYIVLDNNKKVIDGISSWWCKNLGHAHPRLQKALTKQAKKFEHVIFANTTNETIVELSEMLSDLTQTLDKVFYASEGSSAIEIAIKMSLHSRKITGDNKRTKVMALVNGYHGETMLALSASHLNLYRRHYAELLTPIEFIENIPYVNSKDAPLWQNAGKSWKNALKQIEPVRDQLTAIIIEPIVQGAGGMLIYSQDFLRGLRAWTKQHNVHLIADEIMTGFGRTGKMFAFQHAAIEPDFLCVAKGLTAGYLPMSAVLTTAEIYNLFYDETSKDKAFLHSHTHSGNALAAAVALENLKILTEKNICLEVRKKELILSQLMQDVADKTGMLKNIRHIGCMVAADLIVDKKYKNRRLGFEVMQHAIECGALIRPLGNTIYWMPPLNVEENILIKLAKTTQKAIESLRLDLK